MEQVWIFSLSEIIILQLIFSFLNNIILLFINVHSYNIKMYILIMINDFICCAI